MLLTIASLSAAVASVKAGTSLASPINHIEIRAYPWTKPIWAGGIQVTEIWYHVVPNTCSPKDVLIARVTLQSCGYTITTCYGGYCKTTDKNWCQEYIQNTIKTVVQTFYAFVQVLVIIGPPIIITFPYWAPLLG